VEFSGKCVQNKVRSVAEEPLKSKFDKKKIYRRCAKNVQEKIYVTAPSKSEKLAGATKR